MEKQPDVEVVFMYGGTERRRWQVHYGIGRFTEFVHMPNCEAQELDRFSPLPQFFDPVPVEVYRDLGVRRMGRRVFHKVGD